MDRSRGEEDIEEFSWHARIPQRSSLDYVNRPVSQVDSSLTTMKRGGAAAKALSRQKSFEKKMQEIKLKRKNRNIGPKSRASKISIEGRGLHM